MDTNHSLRSRSDDTEVSLHRMDNYFFVSRIDLKEKKWTQQKRLLQREFLVWRGI